ncbi:hypothetical protein HPB50_002237 [Hyalomma asiaticum]|uniref:Uncharacterized protein n=1 Tax=Hyalomma asiaticum TaxID=266040 RepID=A0ACB7RGJ3_HYAAI|nr:hypothetical protein HPB50_002237 [Hyalomma asiaticum]
MAKPAAGRMPVAAVGFLLLSAAFAAMAHNTFVCLPKPVKFDTCTSIRLLSPCQTDQDCDTRVCCKDWCGNYCAFKQRSFAVAKPPPAEPSAIDEETASPPARDDQDEEPPRRKNVRRRYKNRVGRRRRRMDSDGPVMHGPAMDEERESSQQHEYFDV